MWQMMVTSLTWTPTKYTTDLQPLSREALESPWLLCTPWTKGEGMVYLPAAQKMLGSQAPL